MGPLAALALSLTASFAPASPAAWNAQRLPTPGPAQAIGSCSGGCLQGAATLPPSGPGYEVLHLSRNRRYGHPELIGFVRRLGSAAKAKKLGLLVVGDLSQPRGGPTPSGHRSHQTGLDVDLGYAAPRGSASRVTFPNAIVSASRPSPWWICARTRPLPAWRPKTVKLLATAAQDPAVDRIFVNPAVKRMLCEGPTRKAPWTARIRPWWGHHDHFHVRLKCPEGSTGCVPQSPPPDDGCGPSLTWWFSPDSVAKQEKKKQTDAETGPKLPDACAALLAPDVATR